MRYLNQLDYRHVPFYHNASGGGVPEDRRNVATSGCGLCSMCMTVDAPFVYCSLQDLHEDCICANPMLEKYPYYHLFTRA